MKIFYERLVVAMKKFIKVLMVIGMIGALSSSAMATPNVEYGPNQNTRKLTNLYESIGTRIFYNDTLKVKTEKTRTVGKQSKTYAKRGKLKVKISKSKEYGNRNSTLIDGTIFHTDTYTVTMTQKATKYTKGSNKAKEVLATFTQDVKIRHPEGTSFRVVNKKGRLYLTGLTSYDIYHQAIFTYHHKSEVKDVSPALYPETISSGLSCPLTFGKSQIKNLITKKGKKAIVVRGQKGSVKYYTYIKDNGKKKTLVKYATDMGSVSANSKAVWKGVQ